MATLHLICGKIASGKSTLASKHQTQSRCLRITEDEWLSTLYPGELNTLEEFRVRSSHLENAMEPHIVNILATGIDIVLDFHANTRRRRKWMMKIILESRCEHILHFLDIPDSKCKLRLRKRNASNEHYYQASDDEFDQFSLHFEAPKDDEGFNVQAIDN